MKNCIEPPKRAIPAGGPLGQKHLSPAPGDEQERSLGTRLKHLPEEDQGHPFTYDDE